MVDSRSSEKINLDVTARKKGDNAAVVALVGEADVYTTPKARSLMQELVDDGVRHLVVDLRKTDYLDSTALGALVGLLKRVREQGGSVRLVSPKPNIRRLFEITRLDGVFTIHSSEEEALEAIAREGEDKPA